MSQVEINYTNVNCQTGDAKHTPQQAIFDCHCMVDFETKWSNVINIIFYTCSCVLHSLCMLAPCTWTLNLSPFHTPGLPTRQISSSCSNLFQISNSVTNCNSCTMQCNMVYFTFTSYVMEQSSWGYITSYLARQLTCVWLIDHCEHIFFVLNFKAFAIPLFWILV